MSLISKKGFLNITSICLQARRYRGKINVQKPRQPHFERALLFEVSRPKFARRPEIVAREALCFNEWELSKKKEEEVENPLQRIYANELFDRFQRSRLIAFFHKNPIPGETEFHALAAFHRIGMEYKVYGRKTIEMALNGTRFEVIKNLFESHTACAFTTNPDMKQLLKVNKKFPQLVLLAAVYENQMVSKEQLLKLSSIPSLQAAQAELVQTLNSAGSQLVAHLGANQQMLVSQLGERCKQLEINEV